MATPDLALLRAGYRELTRDSSEFACSYDLDGNIIEINGVLERISGYSRDEALGMNLRQLLDAESWEVSREQIREHLTHIAAMFSAGNFESPMFTHGTTPPGVPTLAHLRDQVDYHYEEMEKGAKVRITTANGQATDAIHAFLLFQIVDHQTGDSPDISEEVARK